jgi:hypothetical protein
LLIPTLILVSKVIIPSSLADDVVADIQDMDIRISFVLISFVFSFKLLLKGNAQQCISAIVRLKCATTFELQFNTFSGGP